MQHGEATENVSLWVPDLLGASEISFGAHVRIIYTYTYINKTINKWIDKAPTV